VRYKIEQDNQARGALIVAQNANSIMYNVNSFSSLIARYLAKVDEQYFLWGGGGCRNFFRAQTTRPHRKIGSNAYVWHQQLSGALCLQTPVTKGSATITTFKAHLKTEN